MCLIRSIALSELIKWGTDIKQSFSGVKAILSGPAGGYVGFAKTSYSDEDGRPVIGFDMVSSCQEKAGIVLIIP